MFIDLHGHSRMKNVFFYGCCPKGNLDKNGNLNTKPKQFPFLMSKFHIEIRLLLSQLPKALNLTLTAM